MQRKRHLPKVLALLAVLILSAGLAVYAQESPHWEYEGENGPQAWGDLDEAYALCGEGQAQSPIDLTNAIPLDLVDIEFNYAPSALNIFNNGHTIQVNYDEGSSITYNENVYSLAQFHFHTPSEHVLDGQAADMELHFVHRDANGALAVVGVMLNVGEEADADYAAIFDNLPAEEGEPGETTLTVNAADLLPDGRTYFTYGGSLTTPPCAQGVRWLVLTEPVTISEAQAAAFSEIFSLNARPVQPLNDRDLLQDNG